MPKKPSFNIKALNLVLDMMKSGKSIEWPEVAKQSGVSVSTLCRIRQGKKPDVDTLARLVVWCGVEFDHLIQDN